MTLALSLEKMEEPQRAEVQTPIQWPLISSYSGASLAFFVYLSLSNPVWSAHLRQILEIRAWRKEVEVNILPLKH